MAESIVRRSFFEIKKDPKRAIRKLVDIGQETAGGRLQQKFMAMAQQLLKKDDSPYYLLIQNTIKQVDEERLLTFGMNLGWNSFTQGAKQIRSNEEKLGFNIPWSLTLHLEDTPGALTREEYLRLIGEGVKLGIYCYFLFPRDTFSVYCSLGLIAAFPHCAFCLMRPSSCDTEKLLVKGAVGENVLIGIDSISPDWKHQAEYLRAQHYPYLLYRTYATQEDVQNIVSDSWAQKILPYAGIAAMLLARWDQDMQNDTQVYAYALDARMRQRYPTLLLDFYHDSIYADVCISGDPCFLGILPNGQMTEYRRGREVPVEEFVQGNPLFELLKHFPKTAQNAWI